MDPRRLDFGDFSKVFRSCWPVRSKKRRHTKNIEKPQVFTGFSHVRPCAHASKNNKKSLRTVFSSELRNRSLAERSFFELVTVKIIPEGSPERLERRLGTLLDALGALLGGALGPSWGALGALLARSSSLPHPKIRREKLRRAISGDFRSILVDFPDKNLRDPSENLRNPAENVSPSAVPRTPKNKQGCGGRAKRVQSAAPCVYAGSEAF